MKTKTILAIAILIRLLLIPFFYHPDMKSQNFHFQYLSSGVFNIYQFVNNNKNHLPNRDTFNYLPLTYFTFGTVQWILKPLMPPDFSIWINDWGPTQNIYDNFPYYLLILKLPYLFLDIAVGYLLFKLTASKQILTFWLFNPISFYLINILGNFDILPTFLTLLSYYLLKKNNHLSFLVFGLAVALKLYPLLLLPFFLFSYSKKPQDIIINSFYALIPLALSIIPFAGSQVFWQSFFGSGLTQKIIEVKLFNIPIFPILYIIINLIAYLSSKTNLPQQITYTFLLFICLVNFHAQWLIWFYPFILLRPKILSINNQIFLYLIFILSLGYIFLVNDNYLTWGHLIPIDPEFINLTSPYNIFLFKFHLNPETVQHLIKYSLAILSIGYIYQNEKKTYHPLT